METTLSILSLITSVLALPFFSSKSQAENLSQKNKQLIEILYKKLRDIYSTRNYNREVMIKAFVNSKEYDDITPALLPYYDYGIFKLKSDINSLSFVEAAPHFDKFALEIEKMYWQEYVYTIFTMVDAQTALHGIIRKIIWKYAKFFEKFEKIGEKYLGFFYLLFIIFFITFIYVIFNAPTPIAFVLVVMIYSMILYGIMWHLSYKAALKVHNTIIRIKGTNFIEDKIKA